VSFTIEKKRVLSQYYVPSVRNVVLFKKRLHFLESILIINYSWQFFRQFVNGAATLINTQQNTHPLVLHGNGPTKHILNSYGNYLANNWNEESGCASCWEDMISLTEIAVSSQTL